MIELQPDKCSDVDDDNGWLNIHIRWHLVIQSMNVAYNGALHWSVSDEF